MLSKLIMIAFDNRYKAHMIANLELVEQFTNYNKMHYNTYRTSSPSYRHTNEEKKVLQSLGNN